MNLLSNISNVFSNGTRKAIYQLNVDGVSIHQQAIERFMSMTINDNRGLESDTIEIQLSDHDGLLDLPPKGAVIEAWLGWNNEGLVYKGKYIVKEIEHSGAPDVITLRGSSADLKSALKQKKERSFNNVTLETILEAISFEHELGLNVNPSLAQHKIINLVQNESDANLITRLADEHDAIATVKNGILLFMPKGSSQTISGQSLPTYLITRSQGDNHSYRDTDGGDEISAVRAYYYDQQQAKKLEVIYGDSSNQNIHELRHLYQDKQSASLAAKAKMLDLKRKSTALTYSLAEGKPELIPEMTFVFEGLKSQIDDIYWLGTRIVHTLDADNVYTSNIELEVFCPDADDVAELFEDQFETEKDKKWTGVVVYYQSGEKAIALTKGDQSNPKHFTYLYLSQVAAQQRLDREYALLDLETGKFKAHNELEQKPYTGIKTQFTEDKGKTRHWLTKGDQSNSKILNHVYKSRKAAESALSREMPRLNAKKDMLEQVKLEH